jgi:hypothetical protein
MSEPPASAGPWRWRLRTWSPDYDGASRETRPAPGSRVDATVELPAAEWRPVRPAGAGEWGHPPGSGAGRGGGPEVAFVDGVQRVDAWADLDGPDGETGEALFASYAAGAVRVVAAEVATVGELQVGRALLGGPPGLAADLAVGLERYVHHPAGEGGLEVGLQVARDRLEVEVAEAAAADVAPRGGLVVIDGPLHHRDHVAGAVGYIKSHRVEYLTEPALRRVVVGLGPGERTPLFLIDSGWARWSWYWRLPGAANGAAARTIPAAAVGPATPAGWAGLVRGEASFRLSAVAAARLADQATALVSRFASSPIKDTRAPQNLVPVGGLERHLRHRLGDRELLERALRAAVTSRATH